jgi:hypothetical protein
MGSTRAALAGLVMLAAPACGGGNGGGPPVPFEQLGAEFAIIFCHKAFVCCDAAERAALEAGADESACRTDTAAAVTANFAENGPGIEAGRIVYHGEKVRRCFEWLAALPCAQWGGDDELSRFADCREVFEGTVAPGGACDFRAECIGGRCTTTGGGGTCVALPKLQESCATSLCADGLFCEYDALGVPTECKQPRADGQPCNGMLECASRSCSAPNGVDPRLCGPPTTCNGV